jgi:hypothetical protein
MELRRNAFKHAIAAGKLQIGLWCSLASNIAADIVRDSGFDWLLLDTEHSPNEIPDLLAQLQAVDGGPATPIVRPAWNDIVLIKRCLDIGAPALLVPYVQNTTEAKSAVAAVRYPPRGVRGVAAPAPAAMAAPPTISRRPIRRFASSSRSRPARRSTSSRRSQRSKALTASSSAPPIFRRRSAMSAIRPIPRCRRRSKTP